MNDPALDWLDANAGAALATLQQFCAIPSVSTDPAYASAMQEAAAFLARHLTAIGLEHTTIRATDGHPVVIADWLHAPGAPTLLVYAHYDVQPPDPVAEWHTPPFTPTIRDDRLYARGAADDKGPMMVALTAIAARLATGTLPVNLRLLIEGEEECGSAHLDAFVAANPELLQADWVVSADGARWRVDLPTSTIASRGMCALEVVVTGAARDLHSGRYGGMVANPIAALARLLAGLHDADGHIAVPGFLERVRPVAPETLDAIPFDEAAQAAALGAPALVGEAGFSALARNWLRPTLELNGIWGGYAGPGRKTVIPATAGAKITCRLVPDQDPVEIADLVAADLRRRAPPGTSVQVTIHEGRAYPYVTAPDHVGLALAEQVITELEGRQPLRVRMGATLPVCEIFRRRLGLDTILFSFATADEDYHAPNEFFRLSSWRQGVRAWAILLGRAADSGQPLR
jgi:acetylornithine deacetylase/succinyl-diaminopimelate desuccinylase-like protein